VYYIAAAKLAFHLLTAGRYGIFRDELYYLACAEHLSWGYVDQPPLIAFIAWLARHLFGESLVGLRLLPALAGAGLVVLTGKITQELGGKRLAQSLAGLAVAVAPIYLLMSHWLTMNSFEPVIWMGCVWCIVRWINRRDPRYWAVFGALVGVGMENKYTIAFFLFSVVVGLLATRQWRVLTNGWFWLGGLLAAMIFLPNFIWLVRNNFPFLELMSNVRRSGRDVVRGPLAFILDQASILGPVLVPLWVAGLAWLFFNARGRRFMVLGWIYVVVLATFIVLHGKNYYVAPVYPILFAAGAVACEEAFQKRGQWIPNGYAILAVLGTLILAPLMSPILTPEAYIRYQHVLGIEPSRAENQNNGPLPQYFADEFGWEDMTREVARIYNSLPADERSRTAIFANDYGQAGAIDFFGPKYGLPKAVSGHQSYWLWGPRNYTGDSVIVLGSDGQGDREHFKTVEVAGRAAHPYSRLDEQYDIFLCRGLIEDLRTFWPHTKHWN
jgi:hypothetical protein